MSIKVAKKGFHQKNYRFSHLYKNCLRMCEIWANYLLPQALKSCPNSKKLPNLVTLIEGKNYYLLSSVHPFNVSRKTSLSFFCYVLPLCLFRFSTIELKIFFQSHCLLVAQKYSLMVEQISVTKQLHYLLNIWPLKQLNFDLYLTKKCLSMFKTLLNTK